MTKVDFQKGLVACNTALSLIGFDQFYDWYHRKVLWDGFQKFNEAIS